jgi:Sporulation and spore germination
VIRQRLLAATVLATGLALVSACGVPTGGAPTTIAASDIPYGLATPSPTPSASPSADPQLDPSRIFLVGEDDVLVARPRETEGSSRRERLEQLLTALAEGPTGPERSEQLSTALSPEVQLSLAELSDGAATIDIDGPAEAPSGWASRRAVAQIVLTATSVPGVDAVRLTLSGAPVEAPLPSGELTSEALTAADYAALLVPVTSQPS